MAALIPTPDPDQPAESPDPAARLGDTAPPATPAAVPDALLRGLVRALARQAAREAWALASHRNHPKPETSA